MGESSPRNKANSVKTKQAGGCSYPKVPIRGLGNGRGRTTKEAVLYTPGPMRVLCQVSFRIDCPNPRRRAEVKDGKRQEMRARLDFAPCLAPASLCKPTLLPQEEHATTCLTFERTPTATPAVPLPASTGTSGAMSQQFRSDCPKGVLGPPGANAQDGLEQTPGFRERTPYPKAGIIWFRIGQTVATVLLHNRWTVSNSNPALLPTQFGKSRASSSW
jgi:hypothetical protein